MKIAYVIINANRREGTSRAILEVAERLAVDHDVDLVARTVEDVDLTRVNWRRVRGPSWPEVGDFSSFVVLADYLLKKTPDYDIIHSAGPNCTMADVYAIQTVHSVKCQIMKDIAADSCAGLPRRITRRLYDRAVLATETNAYKVRNRRGLVCYLPVSCGTKNELTSAYPISSAMVEVVPNGADLEKFHPRNRELERVAIRRQYNFKSTDFVAMFSGGDWARKGLRIAAEAISMANNPSVKLLVVGHDPLGIDFRKNLLSLRNSDRIIFAGFQKDVHKYYAASDVFLFPTAYEAFSLATIEAAASGLPVLMPNVSGAEELVGTGEAGQLIKRDPASISKLIESFAADSDAVRRLGVSARKYVEQNFSWAFIAQQTENVYRRLLERRADMACAKNKLATMAS